MRRKGAVVAAIKNAGCALSNDQINQGFKTQYTKHTVEICVINQGFKKLCAKQNLISLSEGDGVIKISLQALTTAALILPGMFSPPALSAEGDEVDFQYSHYQEGKRDIAFQTNDPFSPAIERKSFNPIEVEGLKGSAKFSLTDQIKFAFNYTQDTWGGATPTHTVPFLVAGNSQVLGKDGITISGSSPYATAGLQLLNINSNLHSVIPNGEYNPVTGRSLYSSTADSSKSSHVMASASPETRKQGDFKLSYDWDDAGASIGGGISVENDYESRFGNIGARFDFNQKQTTLNIDLSYTNSDTFATLDHDSYVIKQFIPKNQVYFDFNNIGNMTIVHGTRQDWATSLGLSQILNKDAIVSADFSYTRSTGYLSNPYKGIAIGFVNEFDQFDAPENGYTVRFNTIYEKRPEIRNQFSVGGRYLQNINPLNSTLHLDYRFSADDWGTQAHTFEADWIQPLGSGWTVSPRIRYYSQDAADFYAPWLLSLQPYNFSSPEGELPYDPKKVFDPNKRSKDFSKYYSSDHRLSGFGALSGGVTVTKQFTKGLTLETGFEYYTHQGGLKIGGGGEGAYADFDYWLANAALKIDLNALGSPHAEGHHIGHQDHHAHGVHAPAGVMFDHMLPKAGDFMVGYRYMWNSQRGAVLHGNNPVNDATIVTNGCVEPESLGCVLAPDNMTMHMHMLDLMYAPTDWLTLMLMPQFMDMDMGMRPLERALPDYTSTGLSGLSGHEAHHTQNSHETGGFGDLGMYALFKLFDNGSHHLHVTAGLSAPTADVDIELRRGHAMPGGFIHYGMQLGSGTWDFKPSVTYTGQANDFAWGAQASGTVRMEDQNESGYRLGDLFQATGWGSYNLTHWLTASVRGVYTLQGGIEGAFIGSDGQFANPLLDSNGIATQSSILKFGPMDYPASYGGKYWDVGFGLSATVPSGDLAGNSISVEWLQPVEDNVNGYQLKRDGALSATWSVMF
jgi:Protein of unknown function (DUF3570)